jgi:hypothetical protein
MNRRVVSQLLFLAQVVVAGGIRLPSTAVASILALHQGASNPTTEGFTFGEVNDGSPSVGPVINGGVSCGGSVSASCLFGGRGWTLDKKTRRRGNEPGSRMGVRTNRPG